MTPQETIDSKTFQAAFEHLSDRDKLVLEHKFGLNGKEKLTQAKIGKLIGRSGNSTVRNIVRSALWKIEKLTEDPTWIATLKSLDADSDYAIAIHERDKGGSPCLLSNPRKGKVQKRLLVS